MKLTEQDHELIERAISIVGQRKVSGGVIGEAAATLLTRDGLVFDGISLALWCDIGFCAEHSAVANMVSHCSETRIKSIVAVDDGSAEEIKILWPCGRCRQLLEWIDERNLIETFVIISTTEKVRLIELLPQPPNGQSLK